MSFKVRRISDASKRRTLSTAKILAVILAATKPFLRWYGTWKERADTRHRKDRRIHLLKRSLLVLIAVLFALMLLAGIARAIMSLRGISIHSVIGIAGAELQSDENGFTNILLLGQGDEDHDGKDLTDTVIVASLDPEHTKSTVLLSLPRDLYFLHTENMGAGRLNSFYRDYRGFLQYTKGMEHADASTEALRELGAEIGRKLGLPIHYVIKVDFIAFVRAVDTLGGVDVDVPEDIDDREYPDENFGYEPFALKAGMRHLDGATALKYARSRSTSSDFDRSARQQQVIRALAEKAKAEGMLRDPGAIASLMKIVAENVETTMTLREMVGLAAMGLDLEQDRVITMQLSDRNALYNTVIQSGGFLYTPPRDLFEGASVFLPISIPEIPVTWKQIQTLTRLLFFNRSLYLAKTGIAILNAGAPEGAARRLGNELIRYGFDVATVANADLPKQESSRISVQNDEDRTVGEFFGNLLNLPLEPVPADLPPSQRAQITIILGKQYRYVPMQDLLPPEPTPPKTPDSDAL